MLNDLVGKEITITVFRLNETTKSGFMEVYYDGWVESVEGSRITLKNILRSTHINLEQTSSTGFITFNMKCPNILLMDH